MADNLKAYLERDRESIAGEYKDYTFHIHNKMKSVMQACASDTEFDLASKKYSSENYPWFANCVKNNVFMTPSLNQNNAVKNLVADVHY